MIWFNKSIFVIGNTYFLQSYPKSMRIKNFMNCLLRFLCLWEHKYHTFTFLELSQKEKIQLKSFLVKYQRKIKILSQKRPKRCRIHRKATPFW